ncbi:MAG: response regulator transcription factor [Nocardioides marinisabuli]|uniref:helix-turn-helix transcriptional regulator n=1 Tax=Nocardioides marinisabuli TaxID=419476 RepID=UPI003219B2C9
MRTHRHHPATAPPTPPRPAPRPRISIIERHRLLVDGLEVVLRAEGFEVDPVDVADSELGDLQAPNGLDELVAAACGGGPRLVLLALDLGGGVDGADLVAALCRAGARVLVVTGIEDPARHDRAVAQGALAVLPKTMGLADILVALRRAAGGEDLMSPAERDAARRRDAVRAPERRREVQGLRLLSPGESQVLAHLVAGHSVGEIAARRRVRPSTVRAQVRAILVKLGVSSQLQAVAVAHRRSWQPPPDDWDATPTSA